MTKSIEEKAISIAVAAIALGALSRLSRNQVAKILASVATDIRNGDLRVEMITEKDPPP